MRSTILKTAAALALGLSVAGCNDSLAPTESEAPTFQSGIAVAGQGAPQFQVRRVSGPWSGTMTINPNHWTWQLEQEGNIVTGTTTPAPTLPGVVEGTLEGNVLSVVITYSNGAQNIGDFTFDSPRSFSGTLQLVLPNGFSFPFGTDMSRGNRPVKGNGPAALSATAASSNAAPQGIASRYNADGTLVKGPDSN